jgi:hypothetical protein
LRAGEQHLEGHGPVEAEMPGLVDHSHAAPAEHRLHLITRYPRQLGAEIPGNWAVRVRLGRRRRKQRIELRLHRAHLLAALSDLRQQLRAIAANVFGRTIRVEDLIEQSLNLRFVDHRWTHQ